MTAITLAPPTGSTQIRLQADGASEDAETIRTRIANVLEHLLESISFGQAYADADRALTDLEHDASVNDWDSKQGLAISPFSVAASRRFLALMPTSVPTPHVSVDPDGEVAFEWVSGTGAAFSISFSSDQTISYAGIYRIGRVRGVEYFGDEIPPSIAEGLRRAFVGS